MSEAVKTNDPRDIAKLLRMIASGTKLEAVEHNVVLRSAANLLDAFAAKDLIARERVH